MCFIHFVGLTPCVYDAEVETQDPDRNGHLFFWMIMMGLIGVVVTMALMVVHSMGGGPSYSSSDGPLLHDGFTCGAVSYLGVQVVFEVIGFSIPEWFFGGLLV